MMETSQPLLLRYGLSQPEAGHFGRIANEQQAVIDGRNVPCPAFDRGKSRQFLVAMGCRTNEYHVALLRHHDQMTDGQQQRAISIAAALPLQFAGPGVYARENGFIETVDVSLIKDGGIEFILQAI